MTCLPVQGLEELTAGPGPAEGAGRRPSPGSSSWWFWEARSSFRPLVIRVWVVPPLVPPAPQCGDEKSVESK